MARLMHPQVIENKRIFRMGLYQTLEMDLQLVFREGIYPCPFRS
jgi:hypothetical protein